MICHLALEGRGFEHQRENCCILSEVLQNFFISILYLSYFTSSPPPSVISSSIHPLYSLCICLFISTVFFLVLYIFTPPLQLLFIPPLYSHLSLPVVHLTTLSVTEMFNGRMINKWNGWGINMYQTVLNYNKNNINNNNETETILTTILQFLFRKIYSPVIFPGWKCKTPPFSLDIFKTSEYKWSTYFNLKFAVHRGFMCGVLGTVLILGHE